MSHLRLVAAILRVLPLHPETMTAHALDVCIGREARAQGHYALSTEAIRRAVLRLEKRGKVAQAYGHGSFIVWRTPGTEPPEGEISEEALDVARQLFTNGLGEEAVRLVLEKSNGIHLGGWNQRAVARIIDKALAAARREGAREEQERHEPGGVDYMQTDTEEL